MGFVKSNNTMKRCIGIKQVGTEPITTGEAYNEGKNMEDVSDGYHTFKELYQYRLLYNASFFNELAKIGKIKVCKSFRHNDGEFCFGGGWFIVMAELPTGQISNHYEAKDWDLFQVPELETAWKWDGHTTQEAATRLKAYLESSKKTTFLDRLHIELRDLYEKMDKLYPFIDSGKIDGVVTDKYQNYLLRLQHRIISRYINVLECSIGRLDGSPKALLHQMTFGDAIEVLRQGGAIRRSGWNGKGLIVFKQVPAHIESDVIPKMQSLPQLAKDLILKDKGTIHYTNQCLIYNQNTGNADSWVPSISDVFARDWEIVTD